MDGIDAADRPTLDAQSCTVAAGLDDNAVGLILYSDDSAANAADGRDLVAVLCVLAHFRLLLLLLVLRAEEDEVHSRDDRTVNKEHDQHAGHVAAGCCTCRCQNTQIHGFLSFLSWCAPFDCKAVNTPVTKLTLYIITKAIRGCKDFLNSFVKFL